MFARQLGTSEGSVRNYLNTGSIKSEILVKIVEIYDINPRWLLTGSGDMHLSQGPTTKDLIPTNTPNVGIPLIPIDAWAGRLDGFTDSIMLDQCDHYLIPLFKGADFLIPVRGDSMEPRYKSGDIVACQFVHLDNIWFQWGKVYVLDTSQGSIIKRINPGLTSDTISIVSENPSYAPFELPKEEIYHVALVIGAIRAE